MNPTYKIVIRRDSRRIVLAATILQTSISASLAFFLVKMATWLTGDIP